MDEIDLKTVLIGGHRIAYREMGEGRPSILVHGWTGSGYDWRRAMPLLAKGRRIVALDQLGHGRSDKPRIDYKIQTMTGILDGLAKALAMDRFHLVGNSMGGQISAAYALEKPEKIETLTLVDSAGVHEGAPRVFKLGRYQRAAYGIFSLLPLWAYNIHYRKNGPYYDSSFLTRKDVREHYHSFGNRAGAWAASSCLRRIIYSGRAQLDGKLSDVKAPTLIVWGRKDPLLPFRMSEVFLRDVPDARREVIEDCGHCPQEEKPAEFARALLSFWEEREK